MKLNIKLDEFEFDNYIEDKKEDNSTSDMDNINNILEDCNNEKQFDDKVIKIIGYLNYCVYPSSLSSLCINDKSSYGVLKIGVESIVKGSPKIDKNREITLTGYFSSAPEFGIRYIILAKEIEHQKFGTQYELLYISRDVDLNNAVNQKAFLKVFLSKNQIEEFYKIYDDPISIIASHDIESIKKVRGVGDYIANCIIERYEASKDYSELYMALDKYGLTTRMIQKLADIYKSSDTLIKVVKENPYLLVDKVEGIGFKKADAMAMKSGLSPKSIERIKAYILFLLKDSADNDGHSYISALELKTKIYNYFEGRDNIEEVYYDSDGNIIGSNVGTAIKDLQEKGILTIEPAENKSRRRVYLNSIYNLELEIANNLKRLLKAPNNYDYEGWEDRVKALEDKQGFKFDEDQMKGIKIGLNSQVCLISGLAGAGKSSLVSGILAALNASNTVEGHYTFAQCALSGKASARLQEVTGEEGKTIHRLLEYGMTGFLRNENFPLEYDIIILDEISLVGGEIFLSLIKAIKTGTKLIMLGDLAQLEAIGKLNLAADLYNSPVIPMIELTKIHRQAAKSGIITSAHDIRNSIQVFGRYFNGSLVKGELKDMIFEASTVKDNLREKTLEKFIEYYNSDLVNNDIMSIQLIAPVKERGSCSVYNLNTDVQKYVNPNITSQVFFNTVGEMSYSIYEHDKVMCIKNNYNVFTVSGEPCAVFNGWVGIVSEITKEDVIVDFPLAHNKVVIPRPNARTDLILGYASTVHKLQGSDSPVVIGALDYSTPPEMRTKQLLYTLLTRAKKKCILVCQTGAVVDSIATDFVSTKRTFLKELLEENNE